jgi:hypothetical protein
LFGPIKLKAKPTGKTNDAIEVQTFKDAEILEQNSLAARIALT